MVIISSEIRLQIVQIDTSRPLTRYFFSSLPARGTVTHTHTPVASAGPYASLHLAPDR